MGLKKEEKASLFCLLFPFFGLWFVFWLVPLLFGVDLALQNPSYIPEYRDTFESPTDEYSGFQFNWFDSPKNEAVEITPLKYIGLENFSRVLADEKFYKALIKCTPHIILNIFQLFIYLFINQTKVKYRYYKIEGFLCSLIGMSSFKRSKFDLNHYN